MNTNKNTPASIAGRTALRLLALALVLPAWGSAVAAPQSEATQEVVSSAELAFIPLNPARGDAAPQAGGLWGDIRSDVPSGVLLKFADGFSSPPHIHNITYRAVVISGAVHNDDPDAEKMWMGPGSFWIQPAGESHITAGAKGSGATAFLEIMEGPYLVEPSDEAFDNGERPLNVEASNIVWVDASDITWVETGESSSDAARAEMAFLWGDPANDERNGTFLKLPADSRVSLRGGEAWLRGVVIAGQISHRPAETSDVSELAAGSYFGSRDGAAHEISCEADDECVIYVSTQGSYDVAVLRSTE